MSDTYSIETIRKLQNSFAEQKLHRPMRIKRYECGDELTYQVNAIETVEEAKVTVKIEKFIGGGYAGQVYKINITQIEGVIVGLEAGGTYAMKILVPPTGWARLFRNALYRLGFQGPFQQQVNPTAATAGALWQKFIRRAAKIQFGDENCVKNVHVVFVDNTIGSCGEISDWIEGRTWRLEVDDHMDLLKLYKKGKTVDESQLSSAEYLAKKKFMADFVKLLHELGAYEFARQYEWSTCKSQPNVLKRKDYEGDPASGLMAIDFRAGLTLLPFLPMSPGDFKLIWQGLRRGSIVQFDRGDVKKLEAFVNNNAEHFSDLRGALEKLKLAEETYRNSVPDITHNHVKLLYSGKLWSTIFDSAVTGWKVRNLADEQNETKLRKNKFLAFIFCLLGFIPFLGNCFRKLWAKADWRKHYLSMLSNFEYLCRAFRGKISEKLINWHRKGRVNEKKARSLYEKPLRFFYHLPLSILPAGLHRFMTDWQFFKEKIRYIFVRPVKLYFNAELREQWLRDMTKEGKKKHILTDEDADTILSQINEPYIQKYLKSLAVHVCTLPVTQLVSVTIAVIFILMHPEYTWKQGLAAAGTILFFFQVIPISPGSLVRGFYVVYLVKKEKDFKNYNIAVILGFFKYIGYLAFPIQMTYHYPALARFMASHWATEAVHIVPVFGERGALLEHWVFCAFYNWPLTIRRRMTAIAELRKKESARYWHILPCAIITAAAFALSDWIYVNNKEVLPTLKNIWYLVLLLPMICGWAVTLFARGAVLWKRFMSAASAGLLTGVFYTVATYFVANSYAPALEVHSNWPFRLFFFAVFATISAIITELRQSDPALKP